MLRRFDDGAPPVRGRSHPAARRPENKHREDAADHKVIGLPVERSIGRQLVHKE